MGTIQSELKRTGMVITPLIEPKIESNFETLLIDNVIKTDIANHCLTIRKVIKEKHPLFKKEYAKKEDVKIIYKQQEGGERKQMRQYKIDPERLNFITVLVNRLVGQNMFQREIITMMEDVPHGKGTKSSAINNFLSQCKWCSQELITSDNDKRWQIKPGITPDVLISLYQQNLSKYWKKYEKSTKVSKQPVKKIQKPLVKKLQKPLVKKLQITTLTDILDFFKNNPLNINITGAVGVNVKVNVEFSIKR